MQVLGLEVARYFVELSHQFLAFFDLLLSGEDLREDGHAFAEPVVLLPLLFQLPLVFFDLTFVLGFELVDPALPLFLFTESLLEAGYDFLVFLDLGFQFLVSLLYRLKTSSYACCAE